MSPALIAIVVLVVLFVAIMVIDPMMEWLMPEPSDSDLIDLAHEFASHARFTSKRTVWEADAFGKPMIQYFPDHSKGEILWITAPFHQIRLAIWVDGGGRPMDKMRQDIGPRSKGGGRRVRLDQTDQEKVREILDAAKRAAETADDAKG